MPLSNLLKSPAGTCPFCHQKASILSREQRRLPPDLPGPAGTRWSNLLRTPPSRTSSIRIPSGSSLAEIARRSYGDGSTFNQALEEGWRRAVRKAAQDGSITHEEEFRLRRFRDRLGLNRSSAHAFATAQLNLTSRHRLTGLTQATTTVEDGDRLLKQLSEALRKAGFG